MPGTRRKHQAGRESLQSAQQVTYLGVSFGQHGVTDTRLFERIQAAQQLLSQLFKYVLRWNLTVRQRRNLVKIFVHPVVDYVSYLQPLSLRMREALSRLERRSLSFILAARVKDEHKPRAYAMAQILPYQARRLLYLTRRVQQFYLRAIENQDDETSHDSRNWETFSGSPPSRRTFGRIPFHPTHKKSVPGVSNKKNKSRRVYGLAQTSTSATSHSATTSIHQH